VVAEGAFVDAADGFDGGLGTLVVVVGFEGDAAEVESFEGVGELEELRFSVDTGAAKGFDEPGVAELGGSVAEIEVHEAGGAGDLVGFAVGSFADGDPRECGAGGLGVEGLLEPIAEVFGGAHGEDHVTPDGGGESDVFECREMSRGEGFEADVGAFEGGRFHLIRVAQVVARILLLRGGCGKQELW